jgi:hypothetical protein
MRHLAHILLLTLPLSLSVAAPENDGGKPPAKEASKSERAWKATKESAPEKAPGKKGPPEWREKGGDQFGIGEDPAQRRHMRQFGKHREEYLRLKKGPDAIERLRNELEQAAEMSSDVRTRREKILALREELIGLEQTDFVDRVKDGAKQVRAAIAERQEAGAAEGMPEPPPEMVARMEERLALIDEAKSFDDLEQVFKAPMEERFAEAPPNERIEREIDTLRRRLDALEGNRETLERERSFGGRERGPERERGFGQRPPRGGEDGGEPRRERREGAPPPPPPPEGMN